MWKSALILAVASCVTASPWPNGWGSGGGGSPAPQQSAYNPAASPSANNNNDYWWMNQNPFQKPANHPGVEKTAVNQAPKPSYGALAPSAPYVAPKPSYFAPQVQQQRPSYGAPAPVSGGGWNAPAQAAPAPIQAPNQGYKPPSINFECMLMNKADCHKGAPAPNFVQVSPAVSYPQPPKVVQAPPSYAPAPVKAPEKLVAPAPAAPYVAPKPAYSAPQPVVQKPSYNAPAPVSGGGWNAPAPAPQPIKVVEQPKPAYAPAPVIAVAPAPQPSYAPAPVIAPAPLPPPKPVQVNVVEQSYSKPVKPAAQYRPQPVQVAAAAGWGAPVSNSYQQIAAQPAPAPQPSYQPAPQPSYQPAPQPSYQPAPQPSYQPAPVQQHQHMPGNWQGDPGPHPPYPGCAAALLCVPDNQCDAKGIAHESPLQLTDAERQYRVAVTQCTNPENGIIGVCCRDPNYKDPWPDMNGGGGGQHHHHEGSSQPANAYEKTSRVSPSTLNAAGTSAECQPNSVCVELERCGNYNDQRGSIAENLLLQRCQQHSSNGTVHVCCEESQVYKGREGHKEFFSGPTARKVPDVTSNFLPRPPTTSNVLSFSRANEVTSELSPISAASVNDDLRLASVTPNQYQPVASAAPTAPSSLFSTAQSSDAAEGSSDDSGRQQQQYLIYQSSNSQIGVNETAATMEYSDQPEEPLVSVPPPSIRIAPPAFVQEEEELNQRVPPAYAQEEERLNEEVRPAETEEVSPTVAMTTTTAVPTASAPPTRRQRQRIRIKLVSRIGDQPNVVSFPDATQFNANYRFSPVQSVVVGNVPQQNNDDEIETSVSTIDDDSGPKTIITRPTQRVIITDLKIPKEVDSNEQLDVPVRQTVARPAVFVNQVPTQRAPIVNQTPNQQPAVLENQAPTQRAFILNQTPNQQFAVPVNQAPTQPAITVNQVPTQPSFPIRSENDKVQNEGRPQNASSIFQEAPLVLEIHQGPSYDATERTDDSVTLATAVTPVTSTRPIQTSTTAANPTAPTLSDAVPTRKDQFHLYPFLPVGGGQRRESILTEDGETVYVPSQTYELPQLSPEEQLRFIAPPLLESEQEQDDGVTFFSPLSQNVEDNVEECAQGMKCLTEAYCSAQNPAEGDSKDFDIRLQSKKRSTWKKCRQPHLPTHGYCCYLREDFESVQPNSSSPVQTVTSNRPSSGNNDVTKSCGVRRPQAVDQQDGDFATAFGEFPWQALIFLNGRPSCAGVVLSERVVATSASCINVVRLEEVTVRVGEWDVSSLQEVKPHQDLAVKEFIPYPGYRPGQAADDYALLVTKNRIEWDYHASPICLPSPIDRFVGQICIATGWGIPPSSTGTAVFSPRLNQTSVNVISNSECQNRLASASNGEMKPPRNTICTTSEGSGACLGDHGGPLICENLETGSYILTGILTAPGTCRATQGTGVYTNVPSYIEWTYLILQRPFAESRDSSSELKF